MNEEDKKDELEPVPGKEFTQEQFDIYKAGFMKGKETVEAELLKNPDLPAVLGYDAGRHSLALELLEWAKKEWDFERVKAFEKKINEIRGNT